MNPVLKALIERHDAALKRAQAAIEAGKTDEACQAVDEADALKTEIEAAKAADSGAAELRQRLQAHEAFASQPVNLLPTANPSRAQVLAFQEAGASQIERGTGRVVDDEGPGSIKPKQWKAISDPGYKLAFVAMLKAGGPQFMGMTDLKVLQEGIDDQGGFLVPADIIMRLITKEPAPTETISYVTTQDTNRDRIQIPKSVYTTDNKYTTPVRVQWVGEIPATSTAHEVTAPVFGLFECPVHTAMMSLPVTNDQIEDSAVALMDYLERSFREAIDLMQDDLILNGTGLKQPAGLLQNPGGANEPGTVNSGDANLLTPAGLKAMQFGVPPQYQTNSRWVMNWSNTAQAIENMVDANGRYLWGQGVQDSGLQSSAFNRPLLSRPVVYNQFAPDVSAGTYPVVYGDLRGYYWVRRIGFSIQILNEILARDNQKLLLGRVRVGGDVAEDWRLKIQTVAA